MLFLDRLRNDTRVQFLHGFLRHPQQVGSVVPSSRFLERRIIKMARVSQARMVVELGPGTGGTTRALLDSMSWDARLLSIEISNEFVRGLQRIRDERFTPLHGNALFLSEYLKEYELPAPDAVISGIPFSTMKADLGGRIITSVWNALAPGGLFVAYQFRDRVCSLGTRLLGGCEVGVELLNVPPMRVYRWQKPSNGNGNGLEHGNGNGGSDHPPR